MLNKLNAIDPICSVEGDVHIYTRLPILKLDDGNFSVFKWIYRLANASFEQPLCEFVNHGTFFHVWEINQHIDVRVGQVQASCT